jgi:hypothetical protein
MAEIKERIVVIDEGKEFESLDASCCMITFATFILGG